MDSTRTHTKTNHPSGFGPVDLTVDADPFNSPLVDTYQTVNTDDFAKHCLDSFINKVTCKQDSPLIYEPPKQPPAKLVLLWRSRWLAAQRDSWVSASKRGEMLIMQRIDYTKGSLVPYVEAFDKLFNGNLIASNAETLDALFSNCWNGLFQGREEAKLCQYWLFPSL